MGAAYVLVILVVAALVVAGLMLSRLGKDRAARHEEVTSARHTLRYDVPVGRDPAAALVALRAAASRRWPTRSTTTR